MFDSSTPDDVKYIVKIIDHDLRINIGAKYVLGALHADAYDVFKHSNNLEKVIKKIQEQKSQGGFKHHVATAKPKLGDDDDDDDGDDDFQGPKTKDAIVKPLLSKKLTVGLSLMSPIKPALAQ